MSILTRVKNTKPSEQSIGNTLGGGPTAHPEPTTTNSPRKDESFEAAYSKVFDKTKPSQNPVAVDILGSFGGSVQTPIMGRGADSRGVRPASPAPVPVPPSPAVTPPSMEVPERAQEFDAHNDIRRGRPGRRSAVPGAVRDRKLTANLSNMEYLAIIQASEERGITTSALIRAALFEGYGIPRPHPELVPTIAQSRGRSRKRK